MRSFLKLGLYAFLSLVAIGGLYQAAQSAIPLTCGPAGGQPSGCTVLNFPSIQGDMNNLINSLNAAVFNVLTFNNSGEPGEMNISSSKAFAANGSVNTGLTAVGPVGSHTTVQKWLIVIDGSGNQLFAPLF